jgi:hypothetical protein
MYKGNKGAEMASVGAVYVSGSHQFSGELFRIEAMRGEFRLVSHTEQDGHNGGDGDNQLFVPEALYVQRRHPPSPSVRGEGNRILFYFSKKQL